MGNEQASMSLPGPQDCVAGTEQEMPITNKHYVTGNPIKGPFEDGLDVAIFGNGCFWGTEKGFWRLPGVHSTAIGYCGGVTKNPTYNQVCSGRTAHTEAVHVVYDPKKISFVDLLTYFWMSHDPTQGMGQGNDRGTQYRSGIYTRNADQLQLAHASKEAYEKALKESKAGSGPAITTEITEDPNLVFYFGEDHHQQYLAKPTARQYCSAMPTEVCVPPFETWCPDDALKKHAPFLPAEFWAKFGPKQGCTIARDHTQIVWP